MNKSRITMGLFLLVRRPMSADIEVMGIASGILLYNFAREFMFMSECSKRIDLNEFLD